MLKTNCPDCKCTVTSPFLSESKEMLCPDCNKIFPVKDVLISAGPYSIYREVLLKNIQRYLRLLKEARIEISELEGADENSLAHMESAKTIKLFVKRLKELLDGCRDKLRVPGGSATVELSLNGETCKGKLVNISSTGVCIDLQVRSNVVSQGQSLSLRIIDVSLQEPLELQGEVIWNTVKGRMGLRLIDIDKPLKDSLWQFITEKGSLTDIDE